MTRASLERCNDIAVDVVSSEADGAQHQHRHEGVHVPCDVHRDQQRHDQADAELVVGVEQLGRDEPYQQPAHRPAERYHEVEAGKVARVRLHGRKLAVEEHAHHEEPAAEERHRLLDVHDPPLRVDRPCHRAHDDEQRAKENMALVPAASLETEDEAQKVKGERQDPEEGHRSNVVRDVVRNRQQHE